LLAYSGGLSPVADEHVPPVFMTIALASLRTLLGLVFVFAGVAKLAVHEQFAANFAHWGFPAPGIFSLAIGCTEIVCGVLLALGAHTPPGALRFATMMGGAMATAGRTDGGVHLIVPPILFALCVFFAWRTRRYAGRTPVRRPGVQ